MESFKAYRQSSFPRVNFDDDFLTMWTNDDERKSDDDDKETASDGNTLYCFREPLKLFLYFHELQ